MGTTGSAVRRWGIDRQTQSIRCVDCALPMKTNKNDKTAWERVLRLTMTLLSEVKLSPDTRLLAQELQLEAREHLREDSMTIEDEIRLRLTSLSREEFENLVCQIALSLSTDCGNLPNGFGPEKLGNQRDSCVDQVEEIEGLLSNYGLLIEGSGESA